MVFAGMGSGTSGRVFTVRQCSEGQEKTQPPGVSQWLGEVLVGDEAEAIKRDEDGVNLFA